MTNTRRFFPRACPVAVRNAVDRPPGREADLDGAGLELAEIHHTVPGLPARRYVQRHGRPFGRDGRPTRGRIAAFDIDHGAIDQHLRQKRPQSAGAGAPANSLTNGMEGGRAMKKLRQGLGAQQTMGHGSEEARTRPAKSASKATNDRWPSWAPTQDLASKHPMGRGVVAAAAEAMKKSQT